ncbi:nagb/rpia/CoA transferase-like protein [Xylariomycetidae sp. FL0641]|nr:nagb/rpia/CoA transferase-like protein [Xylariomycetidae sp. FL0641]
MTGPPEDTAREAKPRETKPQPSQQAANSDQPSTASKNEKKPKADAKTTDDAATKQLSGAELKAKAKAEKAARRAQQKAEKETAKGEAAVSSSPAQLGPSAGEVKGAKGKGKPQGGNQTGSGSQGAMSKLPAPPVVTQPKITIPECFSHLSMARRIPMTQADKDVHPAVLALGQQMATFAIDESIIRLKATLLAFKKVIDSYTTPPGNTLARHLTPHVLNPQIEYLTACRPMCFSMGNAIRWLKLQVSKIDPDVAEPQAKKDLCASIDNFIQERISLADVFITEKAAEMLGDGETILVFGHSTLIEHALLHAHTGCNKKLSVIIIDDPFERRGQAFSKQLAAQGIKVSYCGDLGGLRWHIQRASKIFFSAEAMFNNGSMYGRAGACDIAIAARELGLPITVLCETINITERVSTDSLTYNEIDPDRSSAASFRLLFDTTPDKYLSLIVTELGTVEPTSVPDLLRKLEESN